MTAAPGAVLAAATLTIVNADGPGEGFNDPSAPDPASTAGGNPGTTLGAQRLIAFEFAALIWGQSVNSGAEIRVSAEMNPLDCDAFGATLGSANADHVFRDFAGAPVANTWFPAALADARAGQDLNPDDPDINARFNSSIGTICALPASWYYGLDGEAPVGTFDFAEVVLHEIGHGLGFLSLVDLDTGEKFLGRDDAYMRHLEDHSTGKSYSDMTDGERVTASQDPGDLHWTGASVVQQSTGLTSGRHSSGHVEMYAPRPQRPGSSVSHFSTALTPNELMEPFLVTQGLDVGLALPLMRDLGWSAASVSGVGFLPAILDYLLD